MAHRAVLLLLLAATAFSASGAHIPGAVDAVLNKVFGAAEVVRPPAAGLPPVDSLLPVVGAFAPPVGGLLPRATDKPSSVQRRSVDGPPHGPVHPHHEPGHHHHVVLEPVDLAAYDTVHEPVEVVEVVEVLQPVEVVEPVVVVVDPLVDQHPVLIEEYDNHYYPVDHPIH